MSKSATILGLVAVASASIPAYSAPAYGGSSSADPYASSSWADGVSSSAVPYPSSSWADGVSSSVIAYPSGSVSWGPVSSSAIVYPSGSVSWSPASSSAVPSAIPTPSCWATCFEEAGITSEADLCGNVEVDKCIHDGCCKEEAWAYWQWYDSYCGVASSSSSYAIPSSTVPVYPVSSSTVPSTTPSSPVDTCWTDCFAEYDVTSEAELCGDDEVSKCIHDTCSAALDKAYWDWYNGFCYAATTSVVTITTIYTPTTASATPYTTTYEVTSGYGWSPVESSPATGVPVPPAPPAPYGSYPAYSSPVSPATGAAAPTGYAAPSASAWSPVPATGAGAIAKPGVFLAVAMGFAALL